MRQPGSLLKQDSVGHVFHELRHKSSGLHKAATHHIRERGGVCVWRRVEGCGGGVVVSGGV